MKHGFPSRSRLFAWSVLLLGVVVAGCETPTPPPAPREMPDADRSSVTVSRAQGVLANGADAVDIQVTVRKEDGTPLVGRTVRVTASGEGNVVTQPATPSNDAGEASARLTSTVAGTKTVTVSVEAQGGPVTLSARPTVEFVAAPVAVASRLAFTQVPASGTAGAALGLVEVSIQDASGQTVTGAQHVVTVALGEGASGTLQGEVSATAVNGVARFTTLRIDQAATGYTLVASAPGLTGATSAAFEVKAAAAASLVLVPARTELSAGSAEDMTVIARDAFENVAKDYTGTVRFSSDDEAAVLPADHTFTAADAGQHVFTQGLTLKTAGIRSVTVTDTANAALTHTVTVSVLPGPSQRLVFTQQPVNGTVRASLPAVTVAVTDAFGNTVSTTSPTLTLSLDGNDSEAVLSGNALSVAPSAGVATFTGLQLTQQGSAFSLVVSGGSLPSTHSRTFTIVDNLPPSTPTLSVTSKTSNRVELGWVAVGDDGLLGDASHHEVRYSTSPITAATFEAASLASDGDPAAPGSPESVVVLGLAPSTLYYFALMVTDDANNSAFATTSTTTNGSPCTGYTCTPAAPTCAEDGVSRVTYTAACIDVGGSPVCEQTPAATTACAGSNAVCFEGACDTAVRPTANQLAISELMHSPIASTTEYVELTNTSNALVDLNGVTVAYLDASGRETVFTLGTGSVPVVVGRNRTFVMAANANSGTNGGVSANVQYPSSLHLDGSGQLNLLNGETLVAGLEYTAAFPQTSGKAMSLSSRLIGSFASDKPWYWCEDTSPLANGNSGSPNAPNPTCGIPSPPGLDFCAIQTPKTLPPTSEGASVAISGRFHGAGVTDRNPNGNDFYPYVFAELGYGPSSTASAADWTWSPVLFNGEYAPVPGNNDDEVLGVLSIATAGDYRYGFRFAFQEPGSARSAYVYCGQNGIADPATGVFGTVTINPSSPPPLTDHVVISELAVAGPAGAGDEFVELYNPTNAEVDIGGWIIQYKSATGGTYLNTYTLPAGSKIAPHGFFLAASAQYVGSVAADARHTAPFNFGGAVGHVRIGKVGVGTGKIEALAVDTLGYGGTADSPELGGPAYVGGFPTGGSAERKAYSDSTSETLATGGTHASKGNGYDSDNNATDFVPRATREPQNVLSPAELP